MITSANACTMPPVAADATDLLPSDPTTDAPSDDLDRSARDAPAMDAGCVANGFTPGQFQCFPFIDGGSPASCRLQYVCSADMCPAPCNACEIQLNGEVGFLCLGDRSADVVASCPAARVCSPRDCPAGCTACATPLQCIPISGSGRCDPAMTCDTSGCPPNCMVLA